MIDARTVWRLCIVCVIAGMLGLLITWQASAQERRYVDVALVFAVDVSASIKPNEAAVQRDGYAAAIESPAVVHAIESGMIGAVAVAYVEWADSGHQVVVLPWTVIDNQARASAVAAKLRAAPISTGMNTSIVHAIEFAANYLAAAPVIPERRVIDVSGDGRDTSGRSLPAAREDVLSKGITINGLPVNIDPDFKAIADYYRTQVIGGPGSFLIETTGGADFARAVRTKIAMEIAALPTRHAFAMLED